MEHLPSALQFASVGGVGVILTQPDGAHLALYGVIIATLGSILTTAMNRRADRKRDAEQYKHDREEREFQAAQIAKAFQTANAQRDRAEKNIVAKVEESTAASATALDAANHTNDKIARVTAALADAVKAKQ